MKNIFVRLYRSQILRTISIVLLITTPVILMFYIWTNSYHALFAVISAKLFQNNWRIIHAGFCMDQPTIGKWYFWFTVFSSLWLFCYFVASRICASSSYIILRLYALLSIVTVFIYISILTVPFFWTLQYMYNMGYTHRRVIALLYGLFWYFLFAILLRLLMINISKKKENNVS
jgi:hypothetical protein